MKLGSLLCRVWVWLVLTAPLLGWAHPALFTSAQIYIQPDGKFQLFTNFDLLAFTFQKSSLEIADPPMNALLDGPEGTLAQKIEDSRVYFLATVKIHTNRGTASITRLQYPSLAEVISWKNSGRKPRLPVVADVEIDGTFPQSSSSIQFQFPLCLATVVLSVYRPGEEAYEEPINPGTPSSVIPVQIESAAAATPLLAAAPIGQRQVWLRYLVVLSLGATLCLVIFFRRKSFGHFISLK